jgi:L-lactate utilization protein LutB
MQVAGHPSTCHLSTHNLLCCSCCCCCCCRKPLPDQLRAVRAAYLGFGSADMAHVGQLPAASVLSKWLKSTKKSMAAAAAQYSTGGVSAGQRSNGCLRR